MKGRFKGNYLYGKSPRAKTICQYALNGDFIRKWSSTTEAQAKLGIRYTSIVKCCTGCYKTAGGFIWLYEGDEDKLDNAVASANAPKKLSDTTKERIRNALIRHWHKTA